MKYLKALLKKINKLLKSFKGNNKKKDKVNIIKTKI